MTMATTNYMHSHNCNYSDSLVEKDHRCPNLMKNTHDRSSEVISKSDTFYDELLPLTKLDGLVKVEERGLLGNLILFEPMTSH